MKYLCNCIYLLRQCVDCRNPDIYLKPDPGCDTVAGIVDFRHNSPTSGVRPGADRGVMLFPSIMWDESLLLQKHKNLKDTRLLNMILKNRKFLHYILVEMTMIK